MAEKLKPCPFCGGEARRVILHDESCDWVMYKIRCSSCGAMSVEHGKPEVANKLWNRRAGDSDGND